MFDMELRWDRPARSGPVPSSHVLRVRLRPQPGLAPMAGLPLRVAVALDTSRSMEGPKLARAGEAFRAILGLLRSEDRISLASFATTVEPLLNALPGEPSSRLYAESVVPYLRADGVTRTDLALTWLRDALPPEPDVLRVGLLITDGHATDPMGRALDNTDKLIGQAAWLGESGLMLCTVGLGDAANFNTAFLVDLSDRGRGAFLYAATPEALEPQLRARLTTTQNIAVGNLRLLLRPLLPGVKVLSAARFRPEFLPLDPPEDTGETLTLPVGAVRSETITDVLLTLEVPPPDFGDPAGTRDVIEVRLDGQGVPDIGAVAGLLYTTSYAEAQQLDPEVDSDRLQAEINTYSVALQRTTDPRQTANLLSNISYVAERAGKPHIAQEAAQQLQELQRTGQLNRHRSTGLLTSSRELGGEL